MTDDVQQSPAESAFEQAVTAHRAGRLAEAETLYTTALRERPDDHRAMINLGLLYMSGRHYARAERLFVAALAREPTNTHAWDGRLNALIGQQQFEAAQAMLAAGVPDAVRRAGEIRLRQYWSEARLAQKDFAGAEAQLQRVIQLTPADPDAHNDVARLRLAAGRTMEALEAIGAALQLAPQHAASLINQGSAYRSQARWVDAEASYRRALASDPTSVPAIRNLGALLRMQGRDDEAAQMEAAAQQGGANVAGAHLARGDALTAAGRFDDAVTAYETALAQGADRVEVLCRIGGAHAAAGRHAEALVVLDQAIVLQPDSAAATYQRAFVRLAMGDFAGGWPDYEARWRRPDFVATGAVMPPQVQARLITPTSRDEVVGRQVVAVGEQGAGDQIMFASIVPDLARDARQLDVMCDDRLVGLLSHSFPGVQVRGAGSIGEAEMVVAMGSLGMAYRSRPQDFPRTPYLSPREAVVERWAQRLGPRRKCLRVGLSWRGGTPLTRQHARSISIDQLGPLLELPDCEFVSLQYGDVAADLAVAAARWPGAIQAFPAADIDDFEELAGLIRNLDVVVSVQTTLVHLAGAIGAPVLTMVRRVPEWRYGVEAADMAWYGSARLFRQPQDGDWRAVIARIVQTVRQWPATAGEP